jgi:ATP-dependent DNA helicase RecG
MKKSELATFAIKGENSRLQFKQDISNPILVSYAAKGMLPYRGLGSGIKRALEAWPEIDFTDDRDGCLFTVTVHRKVGENLPKKSEPPGELPKTSGKRRGNVGGNSDRIETGWEFDHS